MKNNKIPSRFKKYFWDCDFEELDIDVYPEYISERILNFGDLDSLKWLLARINKDFLMTLVASSRNLNKKTKNFWNCMLNDKYSY